MASKYSDMAGETRWSCLMLYYLTNVCRWRAETLLVIFGGVFTDTTSSDLLSVSDIVSSLQDVLMRFFFKYNVCRHI